jgi:hypothetical protein
MGNGNLLSIHDIKTSPIIRVHLPTDEEKSQAIEEAIFLNKEMLNGNNVYSYYAIPCVVPHIMRMLTNNQITIENDNTYFRVPKTLYSANFPNPMNKVVEFYDKGYAVLVFQRKAEILRSVKPAQIRAILTPTAHQADLKTALKDLPRLTRQTNTEIAHSQMQDSPKLAISLLGWQTYLNPDLFNN